MISPGIYETRSHGAKFAKSFNIRSERELPKYLGYNSGPLLALLLVVRRPPPNSYERGECHETITLEPHVAVRRRIADAPARACDGRSHARVRTGRDRPDCRNGVRPAGRRRRRSEHHRHLEGHRRAAHRDDDGRRPLHGPEPPARRL